MWPRIFSLGFFPLSLSSLLSCSLLLVNILHLELQTGRVRAKFSCNLEEHSDSHKQNISSASRFHCVSTHSAFDLSLVRDTMLFHRVPIVHMDTVNILADMCSSLSWLNTEVWSLLRNCQIGKLIVPFYISSSFVQDHSSSTSSPMIGAVRSL